MKYITLEELKKLAGSLPNTNYGAYLEQIASEESRDAPTDRGF